MPYTNDADNEYRSRSRWNRPARPPQPKRVRKYTPPAPSKPCVVIWEGNETSYVDKVLMLAGYRKEYVQTVFPSKRAAHSAIWHTLQHYKEQEWINPDTGKPYTEDDFKIEEVRK